MTESTSRPPRRPAGRGRNRRRLVLLAASLVLVAAASGCADDKESAPEAPDLPFVEVDPNSASPTDRAIADAQADLRADPQDSNAQLALARAFIQKAREIGDPVLYSGAEDLLSRVAKVSPDDVRVLVAQGSLALSRHDFDAALRLGRRALQVAPGSEAASGVVVDALNELGRYDDALEATQAMADIRPGLAALSRVSYARELRGDIDGAIEAMTQAVTAGQATGGENLAYVQVLLANLLLTRGDLGQAERALDDAETSFPNFPAARAGRSRVLVAQERYDDAADILGALVEDVPLIEYAVAHGDALAASGRDDEAADARALIEGIADLQAANGVDVDVDLALFDADHSPGRSAVARARRGAEQRPSIIGHDALAWNLYRASDLDDAADEIALALETGSRDPQIRFHAAMIALDSGDSAGAAEHLAIVLDTNPRFSAAHVADVRRAADRLGLEIPPAS